MSDRTARLAVAALLTALWLTPFLRALNRVFVLNFSTAGPNATGLLTLTLVTGWTIPALARVADRRRAWHGSVALAVGGLLVSLAGGTLVSLAGAVVFLTAATPPLVALAGDLRERFAVAAAFGVLGHAALRGVLDTLPPYATRGGQVLLVALGLTAVAGWWLATRESTPTASDLAAPGAATATAFLFAQVTFLGVAPRVALWDGRPMLVVLGATPFGLLGGAALVTQRGVPDRRETAVWAVVFLLALASLLLLPGPGVAALPAATASVLLCARGCRTGATTPARAGLGTAGVQVVALALTFAVVAAMNWAFVPGLGPLVRDQQAELLLVLGALLTLAVLLRERPLAGTGDAVADGPGGADDGAAAADVAADRRALLAATGVGLLGVGGAAARRATPADGPEADTVDALTLNVHQWVDARGRYNLDAVRDLVAGTDAGLVGLQETAGGRLTAGGLDGVRWLARELGMHAAVGPPTRIASYGVALLSKWPVREERWVVLPSTDTATRVALAAVVESPLGDLPVVVAHLETEGAVRVGQAERVVELAGETGDPDRAVVLGDFNATPDERPYTVLTDAFVDPWAGVGSEGDTYSASDPRRRIDYAFVGRGWDHEPGAVVGSPSVSDHLGVSVRLRRPPE
ncbi:endonuclease/exonuclease/phosphatase family protein [Haloglomus litoreum]|uniref:endonuclease/exonuclease/phosphatase family protein n=1 Tax=Haloglomus litoreum TaxID=3034026 RepID=UPI0023E8F962|nr:endonuclease/exonuclease/phosphatase family protein [Haloglomus sp. DT116]